MKKEKKKVMKDKMDVEKDVKKLDKKRKVRLPELFLINSTLVNAMLPALINFIVVNHAQLKLTEAHSTGTNDLDQLGDRKSVV